GVRLRGDRQRPRRHRRARPHDACRHGHGWPAHRAARPRARDLSLKALVTGAAGFIGSHLSDALLAAGADVVGVDVFTDYYARAIKEQNLAALKGQPRFTFVEDALQTMALGPVLEG